MRTLVATVVVAALAVVGPPVDAAGKAKVTVTIKARGTEMSGTLRSPKPARCAAERTVWVWEQVGTRGGGDDVKRFQDTTSLRGDSYVWSTDDTRVEGRFYAKVNAAPGCRAAVSRTVTVGRDES